jgi:hypothetical protein
MVAPIPLWPSRHVQELYSRTVPDGCIRLLVKYGYEALMELFWGRIAFLACDGSGGSGSGSATWSSTFFISKSQ